MQEIQDVLQLLKGHFEEDALIDELTTVYRALGVKLAHNTFSEVTNSEINLLYETLEGICTAYKKDTNIAPISQKIVTRGVIPHEPFHLEVKGIQTFFEGMCDDTPVDYRTIESSLNPFIMGVVHKNINYLDAAREEIPTVIQGLGSLMRTKNNLPRVNIYQQGLSYLHQEACYWSAQENESKDNPPEEVSITLSEILSFAYGPGVMLESYLTNVSKNTSRFNHERQTIVMEYIKSDNFQSYAKTLSSQELDSMEWVESFIYSQLPSLSLN